MAGGLKAEQGVTKVEHPDWQSRMRTDKYVPTSADVPVTERTTGDELMRAVLNASAPAVRGEVVLYGGTK